MESGSKGKVGLTTATSLVVGNMIASGVFMLPSALAGYGGISLVGWLISGIGAMSLALVYSWLSKVRPDSTGGPYAYTRDGLGDFAAFLVAWGYWISVWTTNAAIAIAFVSYLGAFIPALASSAALSTTTGLVAIWILTWVSSLGIRQAGIIQVATTILKVVPLLLISIGGLFYLNADHFTPFNLSGTSTMSAITATTTLTFFAFLGLECATIPSENIRDSGPTVAKATVFGTLLSTLIYILGTVAVMGIISPADLKDSQAPFSDAAASIWGEPARYLVAAGAVVSTLGALNGWILLQAQMPMAAARDGLMPAIFKKLNRRGAPATGLVISSCLVSALMLMNFSERLADTYKYMILLSTLTVLPPYLFSVASFVILTMKGRKLGGPAVVKLCVAIVGCIFSIWAIIGSGEVTVFWGFVLLMAGVPFYTWMKVKST